MKPIQIHPVSAVGGLRLALAVFDLSSMVQNTSGDALADARDKDVPRRERMKSLEQAAFRAWQAYVGTAALVALACCFTTTASAQTVQDFDIPDTGTAYSEDSHLVPPAPGPDLLDGGPAGVGKFMRLAVRADENPCREGGMAQTPNVHCSDNSITFDRTDPGTFNQIVADFDFRMTPGAGRADGLGFALLNTSPYGTTGPIDPEAISGCLALEEEPNFVNSLGIGFDIHQATGGREINNDVNNNHVSVHFFGIEQAEFDVTEDIDLAGGQWIHARIILRPVDLKLGNDLDVTVILTPFGGQPKTVINQFHVVGFQPYEGRIRFAARSGVESADHDLDNINVQFLDISESVVSFSSVFYPAVEGQSSAEITVTRTGSTADTEAVEYNTMDDTAQAGLDYTATSGTLTFFAGETSKPFSVPIINDNVNEGPAEETFNVVLSNPSGGVLGGPSVAAVHIVDDESARSVGHWSNPIDWPIVAIHMHLLLTGKVMFYEDGGEIDKIRLWDPETGTISIPALPGYDLFCSGHSFLADGRLLVTGGHISDNKGLAKASIYDPSTDTWESQPDMNAGRWYPTNTPLANGDVLVLSGDIDLGVKNTLPQVWQAESGTWRDLTNADTGTPPPDPLGVDLYPRMFLVPDGDGRVFKAGPDKDTWFLDTNDLGAWTPGPGSNFTFPEAPQARTYGPAVMYDGKVLLIGGGESPPTNSVELIDLNQDVPGWQTVASMEFARRHHNATLLPDGKVLVTGGTSSREFNDAAAAVLQAETWDRETETWSTMAPMVVKRLYHSASLLLPDGRVVSAGGGRPAADGEVDHRNAEIYSPPYLFRRPRPRITSARTAVSYGQIFFVETPDAADITKVTLIRLGSVTHAFDQNQRFITLTFSQVASGLNVTVPSNASLATPGHYMLFILNGDGVPSVAQIIQVAANDAPTADAGSDQSVDEGTSVTLDGLGSSDPDGDSLTFAWLQIAGLSVTLNNASNATPTFIAPEVSADTVLTFQLLVHDGTINGVPDTVEVTVRNVDQAPPDGGGGGGSDCFIATAAYGSGLHPHVATLRALRDETLVAHPLGVAFVDLYVKTSPPIAKVIAEHEWLRTLTRWVLAPIVYAVVYPVQSALISLAAAYFVYHRCRSRREVIAPLCLPKTRNGPESTVFGR